MKQLLILLFALVLVGFGRSWKDTPHKHTFVAVVSDTVVVDRSSPVTLSVAHIAPEFEQGGEIVCIECHEKKISIIKNKFDSSLINSGFFMKLPLIRKVDSIKLAAPSGVIVNFPLIRKIDNK